MILKKYSPIGELGDFAQEYADSLYESTGHITLISDRDAIVAVAGAPKKQWLDKRIVSAVEKAMESRRSIFLSKKEADGEEETWGFESEVISPIIAEGDPIGAVILCTNDPNVKMGDLELKLAETAAGFLAKQMEQ